MTSVTRSGDVSDRSRCRPRVYDGRHVSPGTSRTLERSESSDDAPERPRNPHLRADLCGRLQQGTYPANAIDWPALTQLAVAFYAPQADGSLDETLGLDATAGPALAAELVAAAHAHGVKAIASTS
ncbi:MAG TPA: hypothetical protein VKU41_08850 [Polyangiaceae bacterium]|nr:hypothetical protein [Polyangiaceae bacterium]